MQGFFSVTFEVYILHKLFRFCLANMLMILDGISSFIENSQKFFGGGGGS